MNNCEKYIENISAYADGELGSTEKLQVENHIKDCKNCAALLAFYHEISAEIKDENIKAPVALRPNVMEKVHAMQKSTETDEQYSRAVADYHQNDSNQSDSAAQTKSTQTTTQKVVPFRKALIRYIPLAACLAVAVLLVQIMPILQGTRDDANNAAPEAAPAMFAFEQVVSEDTDMPVAAGSAPDLPRTAPSMPPPDGWAPDTGLMDMPEGEAGDRRAVGAFANIELAPGIHYLDPDDPSFQYGGEGWEFGTPAPEYDDVDFFVYYEGFFAVIYLSSDQRLPPDITITETWYEHGRTFKAISRQDAINLLETDIPAIVVRGLDTDARETALVITLH